MQKHYPLFPTLATCLFMSSPLACGQGQAENPDLVLNSALWRPEKEVPANEAVNQPVARAVFHPSKSPSPPKRSVPDDAAPLFTGENLQAWKHWDASVPPRGIGNGERADTTPGEPVFEKARWNLVEDAVEARPGFGGILTKESFQDGVYHLDFLIPEQPDSVPEPFRGDSGVFIDGKWEIQIIDSYGQTEIDDRNTCGAIHGIAAPLENACKPPGEWQEMEIAVRHSTAGAEISVWLNGQRVHDQVPVSDSTPYGFVQEEEGANENEDDAVITGGPLRLQADSVKVRFANIWVQPLSDVDHATMIRDWDEEALARGRRIYEGVCITCHGNLEAEGSLPTSRKFWEAEFKNGRDPYSLISTLGQGFEQMPAFPFLNMRQRYDVIHYIREALVKPTNPNQYFKVTEEYLSSLPKGMGTRGKLSEEMIDYAQGPKYLRMNFGPMLNWTFEVAPGNIAYKGIAVRLDKGPGGVSKGRTWMIYDHDTMRVAAAWSGNEFIDWKGIAFDQSHGTHAGIVGDRAYVNPAGPGWAHPETGSWEDPRFLGRDGKPYGPLPKDWAQFQGQYVHGDKVVLSYTVGDAAILEMPSMEESGSSFVYTRTLNVGKSSNDLKMRVAPANASATLFGGGQASLTIEQDFHVLQIPADSTPIKVKVLSGDIDAQTLAIAALVAAPPEELSVYTKGGPPRWIEPVVTQGKQGGEKNAFEVDEIVYPEDNPWHSWMRIGGFDFFQDGKRAAVATWLGDVWIVDGIDGKLQEHRWRRVCTGLFQPLGVKIVDEIIHVTCRDQLAKLHDLNGDEEIDFVECFNNDHQVTEHFHEFAMGLQTDDEGNFYYAKSARHALPAIVPHHGTLLKVSADGSETEILATGFRAANGVCLNPDGTFIVTDQEGHWNPKNRINYVKEGGFYGNMMGYHDVTDSSDAAMEQPLCWITNEFDRSPGELVWVPEDSEWGPFKGQLLNLSYGMGRVFLAPHEIIDGQAQGGMVSLGLDFPTGVMRGRFHPINGQLYAAGMFAWAGNKHQDGGFYRIRYTGVPALLPVELKAYQNGIHLKFSDPLDPEFAKNPANYAIKIWDIKRAQNYGSRHYNEHALTVTKATVAKDNQSVFLTIPEIRPTWCMEILANVKSEDGAEFQRRIHNTIHRLQQDFAF